MFYTVFYFPLARVYCDDNFKGRPERLHHTHTHPWCNGYRHRIWTRRSRVQFLDKTDCISHSTNTLGKGMNPIILPPAMGK